MIEGFLDGLDSSIEDLQKKFYGLCTGRVIALDDPWMLGRVQVQLPFIDSLDLQPWARIATPMASKFSGHYFIPQIRDEVLVGFEQGDTQVPYILGSLWSAESMPPMQSPLAQIRAIRTMAGNQIVFTEAPPSIMIQTAPTPPTALPAPPSPTGPHQTIAMTPAGVQVTTPKLRPDHGRYHHDHRLALDGLCRGGQQHHRRHQCLDLPACHRHQPRR